MNLPQFIEKLPFFGLILQAMYDLYDVLFYCAAKLANLSACHVKQTAGAQPFFGTARPIRCRT